MIQEIRKNGPLFEVKTAVETFLAEKVILACGGTAWRGLGGTDSGLRLAQSLGHTVQPPFPAMAPLLIRENWVGALTGISLPDAALSFRSGRNVYRNRGELLFTHHGFSGPCALDLAGDLAVETARHGDLPILFLPDANGPEKFGSAFFDGIRRSDGAKMVHTVLAEFFPRALALRLCELAGAVECRVSELRGEVRDKLGAFLTNGVPVTGTGAGPMDCAMAMRGGVRLKEVNPEDLQSRIVPGLYFAGEMLDLVGPCGGYNIRWAAVSGMFAGSSAAAV